MNFFKRLFVKKDENSISFKNQQEYPSYNKEAFETTIENSEILSKEGEASKFIQRLLKENLDGKCVYLVDFENVHGIPQSIYKNKANVLFVFIGALQGETYKKYIQKISCVARIYVVHSELVGNNFLDNKLSFYAGMIIGKYRPKKLFIVSEDKDYTLLYSTLKGSGVEVAQVSPQQAIISFVPDDAYLERLKKDIMVKYPSGIVSKSNIRKTIQNSKIETLQVQAIDQIFKKLENSDFIKLIKKGRMKGYYKIKMEP